ncbi:MAG: hypothetical protein QXI56_08745 [Candidatus Bathyarchaeia archaeon]
MRLETKDYLNVHDALSLGTHISLMVLLQVFVDEDYGGLKRLPHASMFVRIEIRLLRCLEGLNLSTYMVTYYNYNVSTLMVLF